MNRLPVVLTGSPNTQRVLIGSANTQRVLIGAPNIYQTRAPSYGILEHVRLTSCFDFDLSGEQDSVHS